MSVEDVDNLISAYFNTIVSVLESDYRMLWDRLLTEEEFYSIIHNRILINGVCSFTASYSKYKRIFELKQHGNEENNREEREVNTPGA